MTLQVSVHGRLGRDPKPIQTSTGTSMATCSIAVTIPASRDNEDPGTLWFDVIAFGRIADQLARHSKGDMVNLFGSVRLNRWTKNDGETVESQQIIADALVSARTTRPSGGKKQSQSSNQQQRNAATERHYASAGNDFDDDLSF